MELPGPYIFHGHGSRLILTGEQPSTATANGVDTTNTTTSATTNAAAPPSEQEVPMLHSSKGFRLFTFHGGASIQAKSVGFQVGTGEVYVGFVELSSSYLLASPHLSCP